MASQTHINSSQQ